MSEQQQIERAASASPYEREFGFCRALRCGDRILVAGTAPIGADGRTVRGDATAQARRCVEIIESALRGLGGELRHVVRTRMYLVSVDDWEAVARVHGEAFGAAPPVATCVIVAGLLDPAWRIEMEAEAFLP
jgi:enamine deaminase RidA (YjgF/YER057c/UK114 family)